MRLLQTHTGLGTRGFSWRPERELSSAPCTDVGRTRQHTQMRGQEARHANKPWGHSCKWGCGFQALTGLAVGFGSGLIRSLRTSADIWGACHWTAATKAVPMAVPLMWTTVSLHQEYSDLQPSPHSHSTRTEISALICFHCQTIVRSGALIWQPQMNNLCIYSRPLEQQPAIFCCQKDRTCAATHLPQGLGNLSSSVQLPGDMLFAGLGPQANKICTRLRDLPCTVSFVPEGMLPLIRGSIPFGQVISLFQFDLKEINKSTKLNILIWSLQNYP